MNKILIYFSTLLVIVSSASKWYDGPSRPYEFGYKLENNQHRFEKKDENGIIMGEFGFITADGVYHITVYATDENGNFKIVSMKNIKLAGLSPTIEATPSPVKAVQTEAPRPPPTTSTTTQASVQKTPPKFGCSNCIIPEVEVSKVTPKLDETTQRPTFPQSTLDTRFGPEQGQTGNQDGPNTLNVISNQGGTIGQEQEEPQQGQEQPQQGQGQPQQGQGHLQQGQQKPQAQGQSQQEQQESQGQNQPKKHQSSSGLPSSPQSGQGPSSHQGQRPVQSHQGPSQSNEQGPGSSLQPTGSPQSGKGPSESSTGQEYETPSDLTSSIGPNDISNSGPFNKSPVTPTAEQMKQMLGDLLYKFNYTVGYHGHNEQGDRDGRKEGSYFHIGRDGLKRTVKYKANEFGYQPSFKLERVSPEETPDPETEKENKRHDYSFKWFFKSFE